jgi:hypothetical protein
VNESDILAETTVNGWHISTYDDGLLYVTDVHREGDTEEVWEVARSFDEINARQDHIRAVSGAIQGKLPYENESVLDVGPDSDCSGKCVCCGHQARYRDPSDEWWCGECVTEALELHKTGGDHTWTLERDE